MRPITWAFAILGCLTGVAAGAPGPAAAGKTYVVDGTDPKANDKGLGTEDAPWKTLARAGRAPELEAGDTVLLKSGVYREQMDIGVSGEPGRPITFAAAPGARVVIKGSEIVKGPWTKLSPETDGSEPYPGAFRRVWKVKLGEEFFTDPRFEGGYADKSKRWVSQVFFEDTHPLQMIGPDAIYKNTPQMDSMVYVGKGRDDLIPQSFFFDPKDQTLYLNIGGEPGWYCIEVGVRGFALTATKVHDVVIRGLEMRHNRQPGGQWSLASIGSCERVVLEDCKACFADYCGLSVWGSKSCVVRRCEASWNGCAGLAMGVTEDCVVEDSAFLFNDYRHFYGDWGVGGGMKNIPGNKRTTIRRCECAYNVETCGIWFDTDNEDIRIVDNVIHHNGDCGIFFEINKGGGLIAGNFVYSNGGRGIYVSGSQKTWVVHNTLANNGSGIVAMTRAKDEPPKNTHVLNNLLLRNYVVGDTTTRGSDLTLEMSTDPAWRLEMGSVSDYNVYANNDWTPFMRHNWNDNNTLEHWQQAYDQDKHSRQLRVEWEAVGTGLRVTPWAGLDIAGPLPETVTKLWKPRNPKRVGADRVQWP